LVYDSVRKLNYNEQMQKVRLQDWEIESIITTFSEYFNREDELWLFGSRTDLSQKGGDIDLFIDSKMSDADKALQARLDFLIKLKDKIGDQKIDVVLKYNMEDQLIYKIAKSEGVRQR
jgi:predicted nucleotidyltransferase